MRVRSNVLGRSEPRLAERRRIFPRVAGIFTLLRPRTGALRRYSLRTPDPTAQTNATVELD
jgi:hypothetical protein